MLELNDEELRQKINLETARIGWQEVHRHFARGVVLVAAAELDLVEVGLRLARDDKAQIKAWNDADQLRHASDDDARRWMQRDAVLWALVVAPWVLVQDAGEPSPSA